MIYAIQFYNRMRGARINSDQWNEGENEAESDEPIRVLRPLIGGWVDDVSVRKEKIIHLRLFEIYNTIHAKYTTESIELATPNSGFSLRLNSCVLFYCHFF